MWQLTLHCHSRLPDLCRFTADTLSRGFVVGLIVDNTFAAAVLAKQVLFSAVSADLPACLSAQNLNN